MNEIVQKESEGEQERYALPQPAEEHAAEEQYLGGIGERERERREREK
jgi:hypothetical protein